MPNESDRFIVDKILPVNQIHLFGGASGSGKTPFMLQTLHDWSQGLDLFGYASYPQPYCYVTLARARDAIRATAARIGADPDLPIISPHERRKLMDPLGFEIILAHARDTVRDLRLLVIDDIGQLCRGKINEYADVAELLARMLLTCQREHITVIGMGGASKGDLSRNPRDRFLGSIAWGRLTSTFLFIEYKHERNYFTINSRDVAPLAFEYIHDARGRFIVDDPSEMPTRGSILDEWLTVQSGIDPQFRFTPKSVRDTCGIDRQRVTEWIEGAVADGRIMRIKYGEYQAVVPN